MRLFGQARSHVYACILSLLPRAVDADEVLQETTLILWRKFDEFRNGGDFTRWACGIAYNQARKFRREKARTGLQFSDILMERIATVREEHIELLESRRQVLADCLQKLSPRDRELIEHYQTVGTSIKQVADRLNRPVNTIYKALKRVRLALFECVDRTLRGGRS
jgi:RNA polymerase sigma-70 factor, ECF subfamily